MLIVLCLKDKGSIILTRKKSNHVPDDYGQHAGKYSPDSGLLQLAVPLNQSRQGVIVRFQLPPECVFHSQGTPLPTALILQCACGTCKPG